MEALHTYLNTLTFLVIVLSFLVAYLTTKLPIRYGIKFVSLPLLFVIVLMTLHYHSEIVGRPIKGTPSEKFVYKDHRIFKDGDKKLIELWAIDKNGSRLYQFAYSDDAAKKLAQARERNKKGKPQMGRPVMKPGKEKHGFDTEFEDIPIDNLLPPKEE